MEAISPELWAILDDYARRDGRCEFPSKHSGMGALLTRDDKLRVTVASIPDARTVTLYARAGCLQDAAHAGSDAASGEYEVLDADESASMAGRAPNLVLYDPGSGEIALTSSASIEELDGPRFEGWVTRFFDEIAQLAAAVAQPALHED